MKLDPIVVNVKPTLDPETAKAFRDTAAALTAFVDALTAPTEDCARPQPEDADPKFPGSTFNDWFKALRDVVPPVLPLYPESVAFHIRTLQLRLDEAEAAQNLTANYLDAMRIGATVTDEDGDTWTKQDIGHWTYNDIGGGLIETSVRLVRAYGPIKAAQ